MRATRSTSIRTQTFEGVVLQEMAKEETRHDGSSLSFLHSNSKECGNQCHLVSYRSFCHTLHLPFAHHIHDLIAL